MAVFSACRMQVDDKATRCPHCTSFLERPRTPTPSTYKKPSDLYSIFSDIGWVVFLNFMLIFVTGLPIAIIGALVVGAESFAAIPFAYVVGLIVSFLRFPPFSAIFTTEYDGMYWDDAPMPGALGAIQAAAALVFVLLV